MKKRLRRLLSWPYRTLRATVLLAVVWLGFLRSRRQITFSWPTPATALGPKLVLFMHFDRHGRVREALFDYMRDLAGTGRDIVFVTNSGKLAPEALERLREICAVVLVRKNIGYDFGAWRDALEALDLPRADTREIILANDSVFGPIKPLVGILERFDYEQADVWGLTDSWQSLYHLQSFFLAFGPRALGSRAWRKFWDGVRPVPLKAYIVREYEVGITQAMLKGGLRCAALWPYHRLLEMITPDELQTLAAAEDTDLGRVDPTHVTRKIHMLRIRDGLAQRVPMNPTAELWRQLLLTGFPFLKRELLRDNPTRVEDLYEWQEVVRGVGGDPAPILRDLQLMMKDATP
ncbi:rhamnan synthesis F family protein [Acidocella sp.]|uniref:rhamnan synthesis F family protein n=1 Tax=Acidocella sp. TaxID=50710 RepID=UPI00262526BF|nr:rhamnan synthesis F family protein [Acidocella sp.]